MSAFKKGDVVAVYNRSMTGRPIIECRNAVVIKPTGVRDQYRVRFPGAGLGDPGRTGVDRFVWPGACQDDPDAYIDWLNRCMEATL